MSLAFNNSAANILNTPGFISDVYASIPNASYLAIGTIFIATDTGAIYQTDGTNWISLGGGGGSQNLDQVLNVGNTSSNYIILQDTPNIGSIASYQAGYFSINDNLLNVSITGDTTTGVPSLIIQQTNYFSSLKSDGIQYSNDNNVTISVANLLNTLSTQFVLSQYEIKTQYNNIDMGLFLDMQNLAYYLGDYSLQNKSNFLIVDDTNEEIKTFMSGSGTGLYVDRELYVKVGDYNGNINTNYTDWDNNNNSISNYTQTEFHYIQQLRYDDGGSGALISGSAGGNSGNHLVLIINGSTYKIALLNP